MSYGVRQGRIQPESVLHSSPFDNTPPILSYTPRLTRRFLSGTRNCGVELVRQSPPDAATP
jgi:hypothetical protein